MVNKIFKLSSYSIPAQYKYYVSLLSSRDNKEVQKWSSGAEDNKPIVMALTKRKWHNLRHVRYRQRFVSLGVKGPEVQAEFGEFGSILPSPGNEICPGKGCKFWKLEWSPENWSCCRTGCNISAHHGHCNSYKDTGYHWELLQKHHSYVILVHAPKIDGEEVDNMCGSEGCANSSSHALIGELHIWTLFVLWHTWLHHIFCLALNVLACSSPCLLSTSSQNTHCSSHALLAASTCCLHHPFNCDDTSGTCHIFQEHWTLLGPHCTFKFLLLDLFQVTRGENKTIFINISWYGFSLMLQIYHADCLQCYPHDEHGLPIHPLIYEFVNEPVPNASPPLRTWPVLKPHLVPHCFCFQTHCLCSCLPI